MTNRRYVPIGERGLTRLEFLKRAGAAAGAFAAMMRSPAAATAGTVHPPILPSGDATGVTDANTIEAALWAAAPGDTVQLGAGVFYASRGIVVQGFHGTLAGAGKDATIIEAVRGPGGAEFQFNFTSDYLPATSPPRWPTLLWFDFPEQSVAVRDLTLQVMHSDPCNPYYNPVVGANTTALAHLLADWGGDCDTTLENVRIRGSAGRYLGFNLGASAHFMRGPAIESLPDRYQRLGTGDLTLRNCDLETSAWGAFPMWFEDSRLLLENNNLKGFAFDAIWIGYAMYNCSVDIVENAISDCGRIGATAFISPHSNGPVSRYVVARNDFARVGRGINLFTTVPAIDAVVTQNRIQAPTGRFAAGVLAVGTKDAVIANNVISGHGPWDAISVGGESNELIANNVQNFVSGNDFPQIWLRPGSTHNVVVGSGAQSETVLDQGTDNIVVGVNSMGTYIGGDVSAAMGSGERGPHGAY